MSRDSRKDLIKAIETQRNSKIIAYITCDRQGLGVPIAQDTVPIIHEHILSIPTNQRQKIDLFIYSRGGHSDVPWTIVSMIREYCREGSFGVLIPYRAHSAATVIALGSDEIVMTKKAELGPIDITMQTGPYNPTEKNSSQRLPISVEDVTGYLEFLKKIGCTNESDKLQTFDLLSKAVHPLALGKVNRLLEETKCVARRLLETRAKPFTDDENEKIITRISSEVYSHSHVIHRTEAVNYIGLKHIKKAEEENIADDMWKLYEEYRNYFELENPFLPEEYLIANNLDEHTWQNLNHACIESYDRLDTCTRSVRVRKLKQIPPNIQLNLKDLSLPQFNIPNLPTGITPQQIAQLIQQVVNTYMQQHLESAVKIAAQEYIKSLPLREFEYTWFDSRWKKEP